MKNITLNLKWMSINYFVNYSYFNLLLTIIVIITFGEIAGNAHDH